MASTTCRSRAHVLRLTACFTHRSVPSCGAVCCGIAADAPSPGTHIVALCPPLAVCVCRHPMTGRACPAHTHQPPSPETNWCPTMDMHAVLQSPPHALLTGACSKPPGYPTMLRAALTGHCAGHIHSEPDLRMPAVLHPTSPHAGTQHMHSGCTWTCPLCSTPTRTTPQGTLLRRE
jgi:hypothetical protein